MRGYEKITRILFCCHGNICRSTMAESVMTYLVKERGVENLFTIASAATSREEIGNPPHYGTVNKLHAEHIPVVPHRAVQMMKADYENYDYLIGMDEWNIHNMKRIAGGDPEHKIFKLLQFTVEGSKADSKTQAADIADPWYTGNFDETFRDIMVGCRKLLDYLLLTESF